MTNKNENKQEKNISVLNNVKQLFLIYCIIFGVLVIGEMVYVGKYQFDAIIMYAFFIIMSSYAIFKKNDFISKIWTSIVILVISLSIIAWILIIIIGLFKIHLHFPSKIVSPVKPNFLDKMIIPDLFTNLLFFDLFAVIFFGTYILKTLIIFILNKDANKTGTTEKKQEKLNNENDNN